MPTKTKLAGAPDPAALAAAKPPRKSSLVLKLLGRAKGATLVEIATQIGWQPHSTRANLSRLRTKGMTVTREQRKSGESAYPRSGQFAVNDRVWALSLSPLAE